tara:strand:- start:58683 stop:59729 length:1047 start_codon:yes stop_codon:yes gene_type:complete
MSRKKAKEKTIDLINSHKDLSPEYGPQLANHLPMALYALHEIGARHKRVAEFASSHIKARGLKAPQTTASNNAATIIINEKNWTSALGTHNNYAAYQAYFQNKLDTDGRDSLLENHLDVLMEGISASTFHGLLRAAYGLISDNDSELINGLALWADCHLPLTAHKIHTTKTGLSLTESFEAARQLQGQSAWPDLKAGSPNIFTKMQAVIQAPAFDTLIQQPLNAATDLTALQDIALNFFESEKGFTSLHGVTATHAFRCMFNHASKPDDALIHMSRALLVAYISVGCPELTYIDPKAALSEADIAADLKVIQRSSNDHAIKLAYSAREEYRNTGRSAYLQVVQNIARP